LLLGVGLLAVALLPGGLGLALLAAIPTAALGALLVVAAGELALSRRLFDCRPSCWPVIAVTAAVTLWADPFWGLVAGSAAELARLAAIRLLRRAASS
jgi:MFS superfamily sulfate permease-like transporter